MPYTPPSAARRRQRSSRSQDTSDPFTRVHDPSEFGIRSSEPFGSPSQFRDLNFETNRGAMETMRSAQPRRQQQPVGVPQASSLPSECLEDMSAPSYSRTRSSGFPSQSLGDVSMPSCPSFMASPGTPNIEDMSSPDLCDISMPSPIPRASTPRRPRTPTPRRQPTPQPSPPSAVVPTDLVQRYQALMQAATAAAPQQQATPSIPDASQPSAPHFSLQTSTPAGLQGECLEDVSAPSFSGSPAYQNECLADVSAPSFQSTPRDMSRSRTPRQLSFPTEELEEISMALSTANISLQTVIGEMSSPHLPDISMGSPIRQPTPRRASPPRITVQYATPMQPSMEECPRPQSPRPADRMPTPPSGPSRRAPLPPDLASRFDQLKAGMQAPASGMPEDGSHLDETYEEILERFNSLRERIIGPPLALEDSADSGGALCEADMPTDDIFGADQVAPPRILRETLVERSANENGCVEKITRHILTTCDANGQIQTVTNEKRTPRSTQLDKFTPSQADSGMGRSSRSTPQIKSLRTEVRKRLNFSLPELPDENLDCMSLPDLSKSEHLTDVSAPSSPGSLSVTPEYLENVSSPHFGDVSPGSPPRSTPRPITSTRRSPQMTPSARSRTASPCPPAQTPCAIVPVDLVQRYQALQQQATSTPQGPAPSPDPCGDECFADLSIPHFSLGTDSYASPAKPLVSLPDECLDEVSLPSMASSSPRSRSPPRHLSYPSEQLEEMSMAFEGELSMGERLEDMSQIELCSISCPSPMQVSTPHPCPPSGMSPQRTPTPRRTTPRSRQRSSRQATPRQTVSQPECALVPTDLVQRYQTLRQQAAAAPPSPEVCEEPLDISAPEAPHFSLHTSTPGQAAQHSLPDECLADVSAPSFERTPRQYSQRSRSAPRQLSYPSENLEQVSMEFSEGDPSMGAYLADVSAPDLCDVSYPSSAGWPSPAASPRQMQSTPRTPSPRQRTPARPPSAPRRTSTRMSASSAPPCVAVPTNLVQRYHTLKQQAEAQQQSPHGVSDDCIQDVSVPAAPHFSMRAETPQMRSTPKRQVTLPDECLADVSQPLYQSTPRRSPGARQMSFPSANLEDVSMSLTGADVSMSNYIGDMSPMDLCDISMGSPMAPPPRQPTPRHLAPRQPTPQMRQMTPMQTPPRLASPMLPPSPPRIARRTLNPQERAAARAGQSPAQCVAVPTNLVQRYQTLKQAAARRPPTARRLSYSDGGDFSMPEECPQNISVPQAPHFSLQTNTPPPMANECIADMSAPSFAQTPPSSGFESMANYAPFEEQIRRRC